MTKTILLFLPPLPRRTAMTRTHTGGSTGRGREVKRRAASAAVVVVVVRAVAVAAVGV